MVKVTGCEESAEAVHSILIHFFYNIGMYKHFTLLCNSAPGKPAHGFEIVLHILRLELVIALFHIGVFFQLPRTVARGFCPHQVLRLV